MNVRIGRLWLHVFLERVKPWWACAVAFRDSGWSWFWVGPVNVHYAIRKKSE